MRFTVQHKSFSRLFFNDRIGTERQTVSTGFAVGIGGQCGNQRTGSILQIKLKSACEDTERLYQEKSEELRQTRQKLASVNEQIHFLGQYLSGKKTYTDFLSAPDKAQFRSEHREEIDNYEAARTRLQEMFPDRTFPQIQTLKKERDRLQQSITHQRAELKPVSNQRKALRIVERNILSIFKDQSLLQARAVLKHDARLSP